MVLLNALATQMYHTHKDLGSILDQYGLTPNIACSVFVPLKHSKAITLPVGDRTDITKHFLKYKYGSIFRKYMTWYDNTMRGALALHATQWFDPSIPGCPWAPKGDPWAHWQSQ